MMSCPVIANQIDNPKLFDGPRLPADAAVIFRGMSFHFQADRDRWVSYGRGPYDAEEQAEVIESMTKLCERMFANRANDAGG